LWEQEQKDNPQLFHTKILWSFDTRQEAYDKELWFQLKHDVVKAGKFVNLAYARKNFGGAYSGCTLTEYHKERISASLIGRTLTPEHITKLSILAKGRTVSEETKSKISHSSTGIQKSESHRNAIKIARLGTTHTDETKSKISHTLMGFKQSEETKNKRVGSVIVNSDKRYETDISNALMIEDETERNNRLKYIESLANRRNRRRTKQTSV